MSELMIPKDFQQAPFFQDLYLSLRIDTEKDFEELLHDRYFLYDIQEKLGEGVVKPWTDATFYIPIVFRRWKEEKIQIGEVFQQRKNKEAKEPMTRWVAHFISVLFWMNDQPVPGIVHLNEHIPTLTYKPINVWERLAFVLQRPNLHHSYSQLSELYTEIEKIYYKKSIMTIKK
ncbi:YpoC family protein [Priestia koreensis]|uniref:YpoC family protein n=1 Tax=Priestia koreensis TaxID=284581 RepID=UPI00345AFB12